MKGPAFPKRSYDPKRSIPENDIRSASRRVLQVCGFLTWDLEQGYRPARCKVCGSSIPKGGSTMQSKGLPDLLALHTERELMVAVQSKGWKMRREHTVEQEAFGAAWISSGGIYVRDYTIDVEDAMIELGLAQRG